MNQVKYRRPVYVPPPLTAPSLVHITVPLRSIQYCSGPPGPEVQPQESRQWREWTALHTSLVRTYHDLPVLLPRTHL